MRDVTPEEVKEAVLASNKSVIAVRECGICNVDIGYHIIEGDLYWNGSCGCCGEGLQHREWSDVSDWINMQSKDEPKIRVPALFFIDLSAAES